MTKLSSAEYPVVIDSPSTPNPGAPHSAPFQPSPKLSDIARLQVEPLHRNGAFGGVRRATGDRGSIVTAQLPTDFRSPSAGSASDVRPECRNTWRGRWLLGRNRRWGREDAHVAVGVPSCVSDLREIAHAADVPPVVVAGVGGHVSVGGVGSIAVRRVLEVQPACQRVPAGRMNKCERMWAGWMRAGPTGLSAGVRDWAARRARTRVARIVEERRRATFVTLTAQSPALLRGGAGCGCAPALALAVGVKLHVRRRRARRRRRRARRRRRGRRSRRVPVHVDQVFGGPAPGGIVNPTNSEARAFAHGRS